MGNDETKPFDNVDAVWNALVEGSGNRGKAELKDMDGKVIWTLVRDGDKILATSENQERATLEVNIKSKDSCSLDGELINPLGRLPQHLLVFADQPRISFKLSRNGLTGAGRLRFKCREVVGVYVGQPKELVFQHYLRLE